MAEVPYRYFSELGLICIGNHMGLSAICIGNRTQLRTIREYLY